MHPLIHSIFVIVGVAFLVGAWTGRNNTCVHIPGRKDTTVTVVCLICAIGVYSFWAMTYVIETGKDTPPPQPEDQCVNQGGYKTNGNICVIEVGGRECIAILPDDDTSTEFGREDLVECVDAKETE